MKIITFYCISHLVFIYGTSAQSTTMETNKLMDLFQNQQYEDAINYLTPALTKDSSNVKLLGYLGYAHQMNDDDEAAEKYYQRMVDIDSNNIPGNQYLAFSSKTAPEKALALTQRLIKLRPDKPAYYKNLADLLRRANLKDSSLIYYNLAYHLAPNDSKYVAALAYILIDRKQLKRADSLLDAGLMKDSLNVSYLVLRIRSAYEAKDYKNAINPGEKLMRLGEKSLSALSQVIESYFNLRLYTDCIRVCDYLVSQGIEVETVFYYQAKSFAKLKNFVKSNELLEVCLAIAISKTAEFYYYNLAENNESIRQYKKGISYYDTAYYIFKNPLMLSYSARVAEINLKNESLANKYYARYIQKAKPQSSAEKKLYEYAKERLAKKK